mmetsp:Transcript_89535/g.187047  ORF Transcript_89535/g.187047 Transcript_89535/m.187047 type:complete len:90 (+) Transcript_89535:128-397(+)
MDSPNVWIPYTPAASYARRKEMEMSQQQLGAGADVERKAIGQPPSSEPVVKVGSFSKSGIRGLVPLNYKGSRTQSLALEKADAAPATGE